MTARSGVQVSQRLCLPGRVLSLFPGGRAFAIKYGLTCFEAGTDVVVGVNADGSLITKNIEDLEVGDVVLARDEHDAGDGVEFRPITEVFKRTSEHIRVLTLRDSAGNEQVIRTTDEHPFYVAGLGWLNAGALQAGMSLSELDGSNDSVIVSSLREAHPEGVAVYNLSVNADRTYFVADESGNAVWVHNRYNLTKLARANLTKSGVAVLGKYLVPRGENYVQMARRLGHSYFNVSGKAWKYLQKNGLTWEANKKFLRTIAERGDRVVHSISGKKVEPGTWLDKEINYLLKRGYKWANDFTLMKA